VFKLFFFSDYYLGGYIFPEAQKQAQSILALYSHKVPQPVCFNFFLPFFLSFFPFVFDVWFVKSTNK
jgi:hypothetical protein